MAYFLNLMTQPLLPPNFSSAVSSSLSAFTELKRIGALLQIQLWLKGILWLVWFFIKTTKIFSSSTSGLFCFLTVLFTEVALFIPSENFSFVFRTWLLVRLKRPTLGLFNFQHVFLIKPNYFQLLISEDYSGAFSKAITKLMHVDYHMILNKHYLGERLGRLNLCEYSLNTKESPEIFAEVSPWWNWTRGLDYEWLKTDLRCENVITLTTNYG